MKKVLTLILLFTSITIAQTGLGGGTSGSSYYMQIINLHNDSAYSISADVHTVWGVFYQDGKLIIPSTSSEGLGYEFNLSSRTRTAYVPTSSEGGFSRNSDWTPPKNWFAKGLFGYYFLKSDTLWNINYGYGRTYSWNSWTHEPFSLASYSLISGVAKRWFAINYSDTSPAGATSNFSGILINNEFIGLSFNEWSGSNYVFYRINLFNKLQTVQTITPTGLWENIGSYMYYNIGGLFSLRDSIYAIASPHNYYPDGTWKAYPNKGTRILSHNTDLSTFGGGWNKLFEFPDSVITSSPIIRVNPDSNIAYILFNGDRTKEYHGLYEFKDGVMGKIARPQYLSDTLNVKNFFFKRDRNGYDYNTLYVNYTNNNEANDSALTCKLNVSTKIWSDTVYNFRVYYFGSYYPYIVSEFFYDEVNNSRVYLYEPNDILINYNIRNDDRTYYSRSNKLGFIPSNSDAGNFANSEPSAKPKTWRRAVIRRQPLTQDYNNPEL